MPVDADRDSLGGGDKGMNDRDDDFKSASSFHSDEEAKLSLEEDKKEDDDLELKMEDLIGAKLDSSDSEDDIFDIEGRDDVMPDVRKMDLTDFKYAIEKKFTFTDDDDVALKKIRSIFRELMVDLGIGTFSLIPLMTNLMITIAALWSRVYVHYLF